jgi:hypothetical protein
MALKISTDLKNAACLNVINLLAGTSGTDGTASLKIIAGAQPTNADSSGTGGTLCVISGIGWNAATSGTAALWGTFSGTAGSNGTPGWARMECVNASGTCRIDGDVGTAGTNTFTINVASITSGGVVTLTAADIYLT